MKSQDQAPDAKPKPTRADQLINLSKPFNPKTDKQAAENGLSFAKLTPPERDYRLGCLLMAGVLLLRSINRRLQEIDHTGLDMRDDLKDALDKLVDVVESRGPDSDGAEDDTENDGNGEEDSQDDEDEELEPGEDDEDEDSEPEPEA